jgi:hypothetical protein
MKTTHVAVAPPRRLERLLKKPYTLLPLLLDHGRLSQPTQRVRIAVTALR